MSSEERKAVIIRAAKPLFAEKGFNGTSIRDIAREAGVSEALLYRHFPSKEAMYREILAYTGRLSSVALEGIRDLEPGTETLVLLIYTLFQVILFESPGLEDEQKHHERLLFYSLLEEDSYARMVFKKMFDSFHAMLEESVTKAIKNGDLAKLTVSLENRFWFAHHLAMALNLCHLSDKPVFSYAGAKRDLVEEALLFTFRGIGLTEGAIRKYYKSEALRARMNAIFKKE